MGRGSSKSGGGAGERTGGLNSSDIVSERDMVSERANYQQAVDDVLNVSRAVVDEYGEDNVINQFMIAELRGRGNRVLGYYDGENIAMNERFFDSEAMNGAYDASVTTGFHPSRGNRSGIEAVTAHEYGHALTDSVGRRMGINNIDAAADRIMNEARPQSGRRGVRQMRQAISGYGSRNNVEAIAEAYADVFCNGSNASRESRAVVDVINRYLK